MKKLIITSIILLAISFASYSQTLKFTDTFEKGLKKYKSYISKDNDTINVGDTLIIGNPSAITMFNYIQQANTKAGATIAGKSIIITEIRTYQKNMFVVFKGFGLLNCFAQYEQAIASGEIKSNVKYSSDEALKLLKTEKDKLDLDIITLEEYNKKKEELIIYIK